MNSKNLFILTGILSFMPFVALARSGMEGIIIIPIYFLIFVAIIAGLILIIKKFFIKSTKFSFLRTTLLFFLVYFIIGFIAVLFSARNGPKATAIELWEGNNEERGLFIFFTLPAWPLFVGNSLIREYR